MFNNFRSFLTTRLFYKICYMKQPDAHHTMKQWIKPAEGIDTPNSNSLITRGGSICHPKEGSKGIPLFVANPSPWVRPFPWLGLNARKMRQRKCIIIKKVIQLKATKLKQTEINVLNFSNSNYKERWTHYCCVWGS